VRGCSWDPWTLQRRALKKTHKRQTKKFLSVIDPQHKGHASIREKDSLDDQNAAQGKSKREQRFSPAQRASHAVDKHAVQQRDCVEGMVARAPRHTVLGHAFHKTSAFLHA
jgi:hypothetical protein